jgi:hypothetical protein
LYSLRGEHQVEKSRRNQGKRNRSEENSPLEDSCRKQMKGEEGAQNS